MTCRIGATEGFRTQLPLKIDAPVSRDARRAGRVLPLQSPPEVMRAKRLVIQLAKLGFDAELTPVARAT